MSTHLVVSDYHSHPDHDNKRADYIGKLIVDLRPDRVVFLGDQSDMASLNSHEKGFNPHTYKKDVESCLDFQDRVFAPIRKQKRKRPTTYWFDGNHEDRVTRTVSASPVLKGTLDLGDLRMPKMWDVYVPYEGNYPGVLELDGVHYAHFMVSGVMGRPIGGERHASSLITKKLTSCSVGHSHMFDFHIRSKVDGTKAFALVNPCAMDYECSWAGQSGKMWSKGLVIKRNVKDGMYDPEYVSIERLEKMYGT